MAKRKRIAVEFGFQPGDIVQLKSGGPKMTVYEIDPSSKTISCIWFHSSNPGVHNGRFQWIMLKRA